MPNKKGSIRPHIRTFPEATKNKMPSYTNWKSMNDRCKYGGGTWEKYKATGITVCEEWKKFEPFYRWAMSNGFKPGLTIDRIDNKKGYYPENCRFVTLKENCRNKDNTVFLEYNGQKKTMGEWAETLGLPYKTIRSRYHELKWPAAKIFNTPIKSYVKVWKMAPGPNRAKDRSRTYEGIARAMADQWG